MQALKRFLFAAPCAALVLAMLAATAPDAYAQARGRQIRGAPQVRVPPAIGMPAPPTLRSPFPAGLPPPIVPGSRGTLAVVDGVLVDTAPPPATAYLGGSYAAPAAVAYGNRMGPYTPVELAGSFLNADANRDGELTRAEAAHLSIQPLSFEEMDTNHDGIVTRWEYDDATR